MKQKLLSIIVIFGVLFGSFSTGLAIKGVQAAGPTCYVDDTAVGPTWDGSSWPTAFKDLQLAISDSTCTEIRVAAGTYSPDAGSDPAATFQLRSGLTIQGGYPDGGGDTPDPTANLTTLDGNNINYHVVTGSGADSTALLDGFTIQGGSANSTSPNDSGAGVYIDGGSPSLGHLVISGNNAGSQGAGMLIIDGSPVLNTVLFNGNIVGPGLAGGNGGGIYSAGGSPQLIEVTFQSNTANAGNGGGIYINSGTLYIEDSLFNDSESNSGGGIYLNSGGTLVMDNTSVENSFANGKGGGIYVAAGSTATISGSTFSTNVALSNGGGLCVYGTLTMTSGSVSENTAAGGAGLYLYGGALTLSDIIFDLNMVYPISGPGGGMYIMDASPSLTDVKFRSNEAYEGGGLYSLRATSRLERVSFDYNEATYGGGMIAYDGSSELLDVHFIDNHARYGGGLYAFDSPTTIRNCEVTGNTATRDLFGEGGGLYIQAPLTMTDCRLDNNSAVISGGGLYLNDSGPNNLFNLSVTNNSVSEEIGPQEYYNVGGGIFCGHNCNITNLLLAGNHAKRGGGFANFDRTVNIVNATIVGNYASQMGSAIYTLGGDRTIHNSIVWGNTEGITGPDIADEEIVTSSIENSLLEDGSCPSMSTCSNMLSNDPQFIDPTSGNYRLPPLSPAVDAGNISALPADSFDLDNDGTLEESIPVDLNGQDRIVLGRVDLGPYEAQVWNSNWTQAMELPLIYAGPDQVSGSIDSYLDLPGQSRWYKFAIQPSSKVIVTLTGLPANYDLALYKDISEAFDDLETSQDLLKLGAEFAPDTFSPDTFSPDTFSPDTFSPDTFSPDTFSPDTFSPDTFSPDTFSPDTFSPDTFSPDTFSPDTFSPDTFSPDTFSPDTFSPDTFSPDTFSPDTFSSAQTRSLIAVSAHDGIQGEGIIINTWTKSGYFYVRVRGRNSAYNTDHPFHLSVTLLSGTCGYVSPVLPDSDTSLTANDSHALILTNMSKVEGTPEEKNLLGSRLTSLADRTGGQVVEVGGDARVIAASQQAQDYPSCVYAMNLQAEAVKDIVDGFRELNPHLEYIVLTGNDHAFPFFRYSDSALLASEIDYSPPVLDDTTSQASLKAGYILSQDTYGSAGEISYKAGTFPIPDLAVGRLVETAADMNHLLDAYLGTTNGVVTVNTALVTGYDFLADAAEAVRSELEASLGSTAVDTLIDENTISPQDPTAWTADEMRSLLLGSRHDIDFLAGHFSATSALAADYKTRLTASELLASSTDFTNSLVYSAGCHSGYNIVNVDDVPGVTEEPDWPQAFAGKGATFIGGTGYQYGDTDFVEYSERLYVEFTRQLRYGSEPVAVGKALVQAKKAYLAATPVMRGIHEKSVLEATLFGLPMLKYDLKIHLPTPVDTSLITSTSTYTQNPGSSLGLEYADLVDVTPTFTDHTLSLDQTNAGGGTTTVDAFYLEGPDGVVVNPAEPLLPLDMLNVTPPEAGLVLRGVGWRGGSYSDLFDTLPLTGAATEDLRAPHVPFFSDIFYPVRPWNINYFDALGNLGGSTYLTLMPAQYRSMPPGSLTGILRRFDNMDFRLYYSGNINTYGNPTENWTNTPALAAPPDISHISSSISPDGSSVSFEIMVTGDPAAGIQEVWVVYYFDNGAATGTWLPLDLQQDPDDTRLWKGNLGVDDASVTDLRFVVQAVNGVGLVSMMTNQGKYYQAGLDPAAEPQGQLPVTLALASPAASGTYGKQQAFTAIVTQDGAPLGGLPIIFNLGGQGRMAVTDGNGRATVNFFLASVPDDYTLDVVFTGNDEYASAASSSAFQIQPGPTTIVLNPEVQIVPPGANAKFTTMLTSSGLPLAGKSVALTLDSGGVRQYTSVAVTDYAGQARWEVPAQLPGSYAVKAWFGLPVSGDLDLSSPFYVGSFDTGSLINQIVFNGFFPPVANPPIVNKVTAGSAVPIKFSLGGDIGLNIFAAGYPKLVKATCQVMKTNSIKSSGAAASSLSYDWATGIYTYTWKTDKKLAGSCGNLVLKFVDGSEKTLLFQFSR